MKNKKNIILIACFVVIAIISFYTGTTYSSSKKTAITQNGFSQFAQNGQGRGVRAGGGNVFGKIIASDTTSITVELGAFGPNNNADKNNQNINGQTTQTGSKIVFYTDQTTVTKTTSGTVKDLVTGKNVSISGSANPDGSVNAQSVQIR